MYKVNMTFHTSDYPFDEGEVCWFLHPCAADHSSLESLAYMFPDHRSAYDHCVWLNDRIGDSRKVAAKLTIIKISDVSTIIDL